MSLQTHTTSLAGIHGGDYHCDRLILALIPNTHMHYINNEEKDNKKNEKNLKKRLERIKKEQRST